MKITHQLHSRLAKDFDDLTISDRYPCIFLLSKKGNYFSLPVMPAHQVTNFNGWYNLITLKNKHEYDMYKCIENIYFTDAQNNVLKPEEIVNGFNYSKRLYNDASETFVLTKDGLIADFTADHSSINIDLDFREIFDFDDKGRIYRIYKEKMLGHLEYDKSDGKTHAQHDDSVLIIEYNKYFDDDLSNIDKKFFLAIFGVDESYEMPNRWEKKSYAYDSSRHSRSEFYVYKALKILCKKNIRLLFSFSDNKERAISKILDMILNNELNNDLFAGYAEKLEHKFKISELSDNKRAFAYVNSIHALEGLSVHLTLSKKISGLWAGLPWFFQFWARDELISVNSLVLERKYEFAKEILFRHLEEIGSDGRLSNIYPPGGLGSSDAIGWLFKRLDDLVQQLQDNKLLGDYFSLYDLKYVKEKVSYAIKQVYKNYLHDDLIYNAPLETWMDTSYKESGYETDLREGFRIEIQALFLEMLSFSSKLDELLANKFVKKQDKLVSVGHTNIDCIKIERDLRDHVRERFLIKDVKGEVILNDGYGCSYHDTARPNIFLSYYLYPALLSDQEWEKVFDDSLEKLWCEWKLDEDLIGGGLSTIDKNHVLYQPNYTGQNNKSYHRGDSWFFINNIVAICLSRLNKKKYVDFIEKIMNASTEDVLFSGFIGYASELSSSAIYKPGGCFAQTWSIATFIELMHELYI